MSAQLRQLEAAFARLSIRLEAAEERIEELERQVRGDPLSRAGSSSEFSVVTSTPPRTGSLRPANPPAQEYPLQASARGSTSAAPVISDRERQQLADEIGDWLRRGLEDRGVGNSGRERLNLRSRIYVIARDHRGQCFDPVRVYSRLSDLRSHFGPGQDPGAAVFIGFASAWEGEDEGADAEEVRENLIVRGDEIVFDYPLGVLSVGEAGDRRFVAAAAIGESADGSLIVAFPAKCWNRAAAKRVIGLDLVRKVSTARAKCADSGDRSKALESELRVCLGLLTAEGAAFDFVRDFDDELEISYSFGTSEQPELLPHAEALGELAKNTFEFLTGESAAAGGLEGGRAQKDQGVEERLGRLEGCFRSIQEDLKKLTSRQSPPTAKAPSEPKPAARPPSTKAPSPKLDGLDPAVVKAAMDSGIAVKHIEEMGRFLRSQGKVTGDEPRATRARLARRSNEVEDELDDEDPEDEPAAPAEEEKDPIHTAVEKLTAIAAQLADGKRKEVSLEALLARASPHPRLRLRGKAPRLYELSEIEFTATLRSSLPGSGQVPVTCRAWLESRSRVQSYPSTIRFLWVIAGIADCLRESNYEEAYLRSLLGLAAGDQLSIDRGNWNVAGEVLLEDPPPFPSFASHTLPTGAEVPFTKLIDARWIEIFVARLREVDLYLESRRKLAAGPGGGSRRPEDGGAPLQRTETEDAPGGPRRPPKGRGRGTKGATAEEKSAESGKYRARAVPIPARCRAAPLCIRGRRSLDDEQASHVKRLEEMMRDVICHSPVSAEDMGRVASKIETLEDIARSLRYKSEKLAVLCRGYGQSALAPRTGDPVELDFASEARGEFAGGTVAKPVVASRLEFGKAPQFHPAKYMDETSLDRYLHPLDHAVPEDESPEPPPKARILASPAEKLALFKKLDQSGRLRFLPLSSTRSHCLNGLFSVPKSLTADRMILDARGPNLLETGLNRWTQSLGCAEAILQIRLEDREVLVLSGADLKDYYDHFVISRQRLLRNALAGSVSEATARTFSCFESHLTGQGPFRAALNSMAMGDLNSVEFGQLSHLSLSLQADVFRPEEMLTLKSRAPRTPIAGGVVIDDLFLAEKMDRSQVGELGKGTSAGALRLKRAESAYVKGGLLQNFKKSFSEQLKAEVWGAEIDGDAGTCRPLTSRLTPVISITVDILQTKAATRHILASIAGFFVAIFQFRRRCMSLLEEVFKAPRWLDEHKAFRIWPALEAELWMLVLVSPAVRFNLRSKYCCEVSATDSSGSWEAEVSQTFPEAFVAELSRHSLRKSVWTKLLRPHQVSARIISELDPSEELPGGVQFGYHPVWQTLFRSVKFSEVWRRRIWRLNGILRQSLPEHLSADICGIYAYVGTSDNPADDPTRHAKVRDPREAMPRWMEHALGGMFDELEEFLRSYDLDTVSICWGSRLSIASFPSLCQSQSFLEKMLGLFFYESLGSLSSPTKLRSFPLSEQVIAKFAAEHYPDHEYTSFVFLTNLKTPAHRIWVADSDGTEVETINGKEWRGERVVLVLYSIRDYLKLARADAELLSAAGYHLPKDMYKKFRSLKPPPVPASAGPVGSLVAWKDDELEQRRRVDETAGDGCVFDFHPHITDALPSLTLSSLSFQRRAEKDFLNFCSAPATWTSTPAAREWRMSLQQPVMEGNQHADFVAALVSEFQLLSAALDAESINDWWAILATTAGSGPKRLDLAACARCLGARMGEEVNLVTETTVKLQNRVLADFEGWLRSGLSDSALGSLSSCAMAYCTMIRAYGDHLYRSKGPMYVYRHLLAYMQKNRLGLRPYLPMAWDLLSRWERVEPVQHRVPMPEALYKAMFALGLLRGWFRWCSIFGIACHGIARAGEPLRALRKDLLLPSDALSPLATGTFMAVRGPKTAFRGKGRVQHLCIKDAGFSAFLEYVYSRVPPDERLYRGSASAFRKRWDELLLLLSVPKSAGLTPGGLRGGGAVKAYKEGVGIQDLMWRMRVRHAVTLESYLQEVAALSVVPKLPSESRRRVTAACVFYQPALLAFSTAVVDAY
ncbi:unnamed protein product [Symbiodinium sp. CCMP2456]|nr:unnamed protein product [Symbiodinium sp. CCMP2456]